VGVAVLLLAIGVACDAHAHLPAAGLRRHVTAPAPVRASQQWYKQALGGVRPDEPGHQLTAAGLKTGMSSCAVM
jgi:hypothetical protein